MINGEKYISLYLAKAKTKNNGIINSVVSALRGQAEVYATFRLSVFDHNQKNYFTVEGKVSATYYMSDLQKHLIWMLHILIYIHTLIEEHILGDVGACYR